MIKNGISHVPKWSPPEGGSVVQATPGTESSTKEKDTVERLENDKLPDRFIKLLKNPNFYRASPPPTPPASSSGFGSSTTTTNATLANDLNSPPLAGTAEEKLSLEELKRRRSSGVGGSGATAKQSVHLQQQQPVPASAVGSSSGTKTTRIDMVAARTKSFDDCERFFLLK